MGMGKEEQTLTFRWASVPYRHDHSARRSMRYLTGFLAQTGVSGGDVRKRHGRVHVVVKRGVQRAFADAANDLVVRLRFVIAVAIDAEGMGGEEGVEAVIPPRVPAVDAHHRAGVQERQGGVGVLRVADGVDDAVYAVRKASRRREERSSVW